MVLNSGSQRLAVGKTKQNKIKLNLGTHLLIYYYHNIDFGDQKVSAREVHLALRSHLCPFPLPIPDFVI